MQLDEFLLVIFVVLIYLMILFSNNKSNLAYDLDISHGTASS